MLIAEGGLKASLTTVVLLEESVFGWKEFEMEVMRDKNDNTVIICAIENMDPMGIHTGDSITVAPAQTLTDHEYQIMRDASLKVCDGRSGNRRVERAILYSSTDGSLGSH